MSQVDVKTATGGDGGTVDLPDELFGIEPNVAVMHDSVDAAHEGGGGPQPERGHESPSEKTHASILAQHTPPPPPRPPAPWPWPCRWGWATGW